MIKTLILFLSICFISPLVAALPPAWQQVAELKAILNDQELKNYLDSADQIETIQKTAKGYLFKTRLTTIQVEIISLPTQQPGPASFKIQFLPLKI